MCWPLVIGAVLTAASAAANSIANSNVASARTGAMAAERERQSALDTEKNAVNANALSAYADVPGKQVSDATKLSDYFTQQHASIPTTAPNMPASSSNLVVQEQKKQQGLAKLYTDQQGEALGQLRAFGDVMGDTSRATARDAGQISQLNNFKAGSAAVFPYELDASGNSGNGLKSVGDISGGLGQMFLTYGLTKGAGTSGSSSGYSNTGLGALSSLFGRNGGS